MPGHPDGQNYAIWRGPDFLANPTFPLSSSNPCIVSGQITNYASLYIEMGINNPGGAGFVVNWFTDSSLSVPVNADGFVMPNGSQVALLLPAQGNFCRINITTSDVASTNSAIAIFPTNTPAAVASPVQSSTRVESVSTSVGASSTLTVQIPWIQPGPMHIYVQDLTSSTKLGYQIAEVGSGGTIFGIVRQILQPFVIDQADINVTAVPMVLRVINSDAANPHTVSYFISRSPG